MKLHELLDDQPRGKIDKSVVVYMTPDLNNKDFTCGGCALFIRSKSQCSILEPSNVDEDDGCTLYVPGKQAAGGKVASIPAELAGLEDGPFTCGRCKNFHQTDRTGVGTCEVVEGSVHKNGCCNAWASKHEV